MRKFLKRLIYFFLASNNRIKLYRKIRLIFNSLPSASIIKISSTNKNEHQNKWKQLGSKPDMRWYKVYATICGIDSPDYITETDYYNKVELTLNNRTFSEAYCDKNYYHRYIENSLLPHIWLRNIQGVYYSADYSLIGNFESTDEFIPGGADKVIVKKAIDSGGGRGVELFFRGASGFQNYGGQLLTRDYLESNYKKNFIVQEYVQQHNYFSRFNESSVNTVRILTYRCVVSNKVVALQSVLRIGMKGAVVDNQASGGIACGINGEGKLNSFAINKSGKIFTKINDIPFFDQPPVFKFGEMLNYAIKIAGLNYYHRLIGFDFCIDSNGSVKLIELNNRNNEINFYQMNNGPLFREYTDEVIQYCCKNARNICFDFEV